MAESSTRSQLEERFGGGGLPEDVMAEGEWASERASVCSPAEWVCIYRTALSILRLYALTPADLYFKWEAFLLSSSSSNGSTLAFNLDNLRELKKEIQLSAATSSHHGNGLSSPGLAAASTSAASASTNNSRIKKLAGRAALDGMQAYHYQG